MNAAAYVLLALAFVAALVDWWSVGTERLGVEFMAKPAVVIGLIGVALAVDIDPGGPPTNISRGLVVAALGASLVGDVALMTPDARFEAGLAAFLLAHLLYAVAFLPEFEIGPGLAAAILVVGFGAGVVPQVMNAVKSRGRLISVAVGVYIFAVSLTAVSAVGTGVVLAGIGGGLFLASDALLGWGRFVGPAPGGRVLVHSTYHVGQAGLVLWLAS